MKYIPSLEARLSGLTPPRPERGSTLRPGIGPVRENAATEGSAPEGVRPARRCSAPESAGPTDLEPRAKTDGQSRSGHVLSGRSRQIGGPEEPSRPDDADVRRELPPELIAQPQPEFARG